MAESAAEEKENKEQAPQEEPKAEGAVLNGLFAQKVGMSTIYNSDGDVVPVTVLKLDQWKVSQIKTKEKDGYSAVQIAGGKKSAKKVSKALKQHLKASGFENGAKWVREVRQDIPEGIKVGDAVSIDSVKPGDRVRLSSLSKGRGFSGAMRRHGFGGGPASHGSGFHRRPGSIGNCTFPGRVMPGRKMPGQFGNEKTTLKRVEIVDVIKDENVLLVKGAVPGATNALVQLIKE